MFLAPHPDDVALSCGGTVALLAERGASPLIVTVFGGEPSPDNLTAFARWQHERWGTGEADTIAARLAEDRAAAAALGAESAALPFLDAIYRGDHYLSDETLFGDVAPDDLPLIARIADAVAALPPLAGLAGATIHVPLGIGNHVDHQIVYEVGKRLAARGARVLAYEDFPYAALGDAAARRRAAVGTEVGAPLVVPIGATIGRRLAAIGAYATQLPTIFRFTDDWRAATRSLATAVGGAAGLAERFWPLNVPS